MVLRVKILLSFFRSARETVIDIVILVVFNKLLRVSSIDWKNEWGWLEIFVDILGGGCLEWEWKIGYGRSPSTSHLRRQRKQCSPLLRITGTRRLPNSKQNINYMVTTLAYICTTMQCMYLFLGIFWYSDLGHAFMLGSEVLMKG